MLNDGKIWVKLKITEVGYMYNCTVILTIFTQFQIKVLFKLLHRRQSFAFLFFSKTISNLDIFDICEVKNKQIN